MSQSIRFLGLAILAWASVRAVGVALGSDGRALSINTPEHAETAALLPPISPTRFDPVEPVVPAGAAMPPEPAGTSPYSYVGAYASPYQQAAYGGYPVPQAYPYPVYIPVQQAAYRQSAPVPRRDPRYVIDPAPRANWLDGAPDPDPYPMSRMAAAGPVRPALQVSPTFTGDTPKRGYDRWELSSWAMLRSRPGPSTLAANGMLGGSQAGARLLYRFDPRLAVSVRSTAALQSRERGMEIAAGLRAQPLRSLPVAFTIERRQWVGKGMGQSNFALFAEGGLWGKPLPFNMTLDGYLQAGVVGIRDRAWFVDGSATATRPVWRNLSAGVGVWGGAQQGLKRLDAGPRLTMQMGRGMRIHADYRAKILGNAEPGSGGVVTLAGDF